MAPRPFVYGNRTQLSDSLKGAFPIVFPERPDGNCANPPMICPLTHLLLRRETVSWPVSPAAVTRVKTRSVEWFTGSLVRQRAVQRTVFASAADAMNRSSPANKMFPIGSPPKFVSYLGSQQLSSSIHAMQHAALDPQMTSLLSESTGHRHSLICRGDMLPFRDRVLTFLGTDWSLPSRAWRGSTKRAHPGDSALSVRSGTRSFYLAAWH